MSSGDALGSYSSGSFYSRTIFHRGFETYPLAGKYAHIEVLEDGKYSIQHSSMYKREDTLAAMTFIHESIHYLQDLITGYGHSVSYLARRLPGFFTDFFLKIQTEDVWIPLKDWKVANEHDRRLLRRLQAEISALDRIMKWLSLPGAQKMRIDGKEENENELGTCARSILEGMAFCISENYLFDQLEIAQELGHKIRKGMKVLDLSYYDPIYSEARRLFEHVVRPTLTNFSEKEKRDLFILLCDLALHIPPLTKVSSIVEAGKNKSVDFIPGCRFVEAARIVARTPDKFKGDIFEKYEHYADKICLNNRLRWPSMAETTELLIEELKRLKKKSTDFSIDMQIRATKARLRTPGMFLEPLLDAFSEAKFVMTYFTPTEPRWIMLFPDDHSKMGTTYKNSDAYRTLVTVWHKIFLDSVPWQFLLGKRIVCPFLEFPLDCKIKRKECSIGLDTKDEYYKHDCAVQRMLKGHLGIELENTHYLY